MRLQLPWDTPVSLALFVWVCTLPLIGLVVVPFLGLGISLTVAVALLIIILVVCWLLCFGALPGLPSGIDWRVEEVSENEETGR